jgi:hypothetical protein
MLQASYCFKFSKEAGVPIIKNFTIKILFILMMAAAGCAKPPTAEPFFRRRGFQPRSARQHTPQMQTRLEASSTLNHHMALVATVLLNLL